MDEFQVFPTKDQPVEKKLNLETLQPQGTCRTRRLPDDWSLGDMSLCGHAKNGRMGCAGFPCPVGLFHDVLCLNVYVSMMEIHKLDPGLAVD